MLTFFLKEFLRTFFIKCEINLSSAFFVCLSQLSGYEEEDPGPATEDQRDGWTQAMLCLSGQRGLQEMLR